MNPFDDKSRIDKINALDSLTDYGTTHMSLKSQYIDCNIINLASDQRVFRVMPLERLKEVLLDKSLTLVRPKLWEDPYENFILSATVPLPDSNSASLSPIRDSYYGQCWTLREECDGLWRNFKGDQVGTKVKTNVGKLMEYFYEISNPFHYISYFIGKVRYYSEDEIKKFFFTDFDLLGAGGQPTPFVLGLLTKRKQFSYEEEVRLIFHKPSTNLVDMSTLTNPWDNTDFFKVNIDPNDLFEEITIEPWINKKDFEEVRAELIALGYTGSVTRSELYDKPHFSLPIKYVSH